MTHPFDFDRIIDRYPTSSLKWTVYQDRNIIPLWVADMDFESPPAVIQALQDRVRHGVFGYTKIPNELVDTIVARLAALYNWQIDTDWIVPIPCLVSGLNLACRSVGNDGDSVLSVTPVYPPFLAAPANSRRELVTAPLTKEDEMWVMDYDAMNGAVNDRTGLFLFCNPHNPTGRVYSRQELLDVAAWCDHHDLILCSDEIHCDLLLDKDARHIPIASIDPEIAKRTITLMSPSKTFNIAGLGFGFAIISDLELRTRFKKEMMGIVPHINIMGYAAALAAFREGDEWLKAVLDYLRVNRDLLQETVDGCNGVSMTHIQGTYLGWIDTTPLGLDDPHGWFQKFGLGFSNGSDFKGDGYVRFNFGCPRSLLNTALERFRQAVTSV